ncbi:hypothetical protein ZHAS_00007030 [Anopheles sinensis]|uniref:Uncharacterized protein n=1 Tax=Anopheles sinensis TaxID=74873 RepID=A0A084VNP9_ANOSI|nr:hypothetical protein ZHAS_00007030 [Anopheles sinensis]
MERITGNGFRRDSGSRLKCEVKRTKSSVVRIYERESTEPFGIGGTVRICDHVLRSAQEFYDAMGS